ncbi:SET domain-containing protein, putative isoform 3 [Hibiscus syriacus]|uniref:SET domain-containing protein, putative isoform 3 n=1 Tax=Hibiscus syriacus TaxID=106335 RepID=A0A6A3CFU4_HIBSY|nr:SET domain-containing protein, putative isoform 3 [Hibiscus syriacus]
MEMRGEENIEIGEDITPPLLPLSFSLHDSFRSSHCSSCFSPLSSPSHPSHAPLYCSAACSSSHSAIASSSSESLLPPSSPLSSELRTALRLLLSLPSLCPHLRRFNNGLLTNHHKLSSSPEFATQIRQGAIAMAAARKSRNGDCVLDQSDSVLLEEAVLCLVLTNAVEVQDEAGRSLGIAVYDPNFSWINHSCSPNAGYRFSVSPPNDTSFGEDSSSTLRIVPSISEDESGVCSCSDYMEGAKGYGYGPKIIVRSIKRIKKGEEVCVSYTDLLQPKAMRQSDLWFKYQFTCSCRRCAMDEANKKLSDYVDKTINEFLSVGDPESCCMKLESVLSLGLQIEQIEHGDGKSHLNVKFHPFHHVALSAYTTLSSVYRIRSSDVLALHSRTDESLFKAFDMSRISAAYSLLLAGASHHLFCLESSLLASAANFWKQAGDSLLSLARNRVWNSLGFLVSDLSTVVKYKCSKCSLLDISAAEFFSQAERANVENISSDFLACVSNMAPMIWRFLINGCHYLETIEDPFDFQWLALLNRDEEHDGFVNESSSFEHRAELYTNERRIHIYKVGIHCLMYGVILAQICYGQNSHFTPILNLGEYFVN